MAKVVDRDLGFRKLQRQLKALGKKRVGVTVGVHEDEGDHAVVKAASNEFGTSRIPERSFLRETFDLGATQALDDLEAAVSQALDGDDLEGLLDGVGEEWRDRVRKTIDDKKDPPNAEQTIEEKGFDDPLVNTGDMIESIKHKLVEG